MSSLRFVETGSHIAAIQDERVVGTIGVLTRTDGVGLVFPPELDGGPPGLAEQLVSAAVTRLQRAGATFAQLTLPVAEATQAAPFVQQGFAHLTDALLLSHALQPAPALMAPARLTAIPCDPVGDEALLIELIARINRGSLDCPELDLFRTPAMLLASHREASLEGGARWRRYEESGNTVGATLATVVDDEEAWELLFFGICPAARGRGYGRVLLQQLVDEAYGKTSRIRAAVDARNHYAIESYVAAGFVEEGRVRVWIHSFAPSA